MKTTGEAREDVLSLTAQYKTLLNLSMMLIDLPRAVADAEARQAAQAEKLLKFQKSQEGVNS